MCLNPFENRAHFLHELLTDNRFLYKGSFIPLHNSRLFLVQNFLHFWSLTVPTFHTNRPSLKEPVRKQLAADVAAFIAAGGRITIVPAGASGEKPLTLTEKQP